MTHSEELVTVVIAAYTAEATFDATLSSARNQTYRNLEINVVVDGATDDTETVARQRASANDRDTQSRVLCGAQRGD